MFGVQQGECESMKEMERERERERVYNGKCVKSE